MCTMIAVKVPIAGSAKAAEGWVRIREAFVGCDHATRAWTDHAVRLDFRSAGSREACVAVEMDVRVGKSAARGSRGGDRCSGTERDERVANVPDVVVLRSSRTRIDAPVSSVALKRARSRHDARGDREPAGAGQTRNAADAATDSATTIAMFTRSAAGSVSVTRGRRRPRRLENIPKKTDRCASHVAVATDDREARRAT